MPDIPVDDINQDAPQVGPSAGISPSYNAGQFGASIGQALDQVGKEVGQYALREQRYMDAENVADKRTQVSIKRINSLKDPNTGLLNQNITDPDQLHAAADKSISDFDEHISTVSQGLTNDRQRAAFDKAMREERFSMQSAVRDWEYQQGNTIAKSKMVNGVKVMQANASQFYGQPTVDPESGKPVNPVEQSISQQKELIATTADHLHWTPEQTQVAQAQAANDTHVGVLQSMLVPGKPAQAAADYFNKVKGDMFPQDQDRFGRAVETAELQQKSGAISHELMYDQDGRPRSTADVMNAMAQDSRLTGDARLADEVERQVGRSMRLKNAAQAEVQSNTFDKVWNGLPSVGGDLTQVPPDVMQSLSPAHQEQLQKYAKQIQENKFAPDNSDAYYALRSKAVNPEGSAQFRDEDLRQYRSQLSPKDYADVVNLQMELRGKAPGQTKGINAVSTKEEIVKPAIKGLNDEDANDFRRKLDMAVDANGGMEKVGTVGLQKIVDKLTIDTATQVPRSIVNPMRWFGDANTSGTQPFFKTIPKGYAFGAADIPPEAMAAQRQKAQARGITNPSNQQLIDAYNADLTHAGP